jgi:hypothetical protein
MRGSLRGSFAELPGAFLGQQFAMCKGTLAIGNIWNIKKYLTMYIYIYIWVCVCVWYVVNVGI